MNFFLRAIRSKLKNKKITLLDIKIYTVHHHNLKVWRGVDQPWTFSEKAISYFWVTYEKFQNPETIQDFFSNAIHIKGLKIGWKKVHRKSLSLRVRKNSCNLIFYGPNLLVWVTHGKFELEWRIQKLFIVKPRATAQAPATAPQRHCGRVIDTSGRTTGVGGHLQKYRQVRNTINQQQPWSRDYLHRFHEFLMKNWKAKNGFFGSAAQLRKKSMNWFLLWSERSETKLKTTIHCRLRWRSLPLKRPEVNEPSVSTDTGELNYPPTHH